MITAQLGHGAGRTGCTGWTGLGEREGVGEDPRGRNAQEAALAPRPPGDPAPGPARPGHLRPAPAAPEPGKGGGAPLLWEGRVPVATRSVSGNSNPATLGMR